MLKSMITAIKNEISIMSFLVIFAIPLLINVLLGYEFKADQIQNVSMAIYDQDNSPLSRMIVNQFNEDEIFDVKYFLDNKEDMEQLFDDSQVKIGMIIPKDFGKDVMNADGPKVLMFYDGSHTPITSAAKGKATEILLTLKVGMSMKVLEAKLNLPHDIAEKTALAVSFKNRFLYNPTKSYRAFLNIGMGTAAAQSGLALMAVAAIDFEVLRKKRKYRIGHILGKIIFYGFTGWLSLLGAILINWKVFNIPFRGDFADAAILSLLLSTSVTTFCIMLSLFIRKNQSILLATTAIIFIPNSVMVGFTYPVIGMPKIYQVIANYYPFYHFSDNIREIFLKGRGLETMQMDIIFFEKFILITLAVVVVISLMTKVKNENKIENKEDKNILGKEGDVNVAS